MDLSALPLLSIGATIFLAGLGLGWLIPRRQSVPRLPPKTALENELVDLRTRHHTLDQEHRDLRTKLKNTEAERNENLRLLRTNSSHSDFLKVRKRLELAHKQLGMLIAALRQKEQQVDRLTDFARQLKTELGKYRQPLLAASNRPNHLPIVNCTADDLQLIEGITTAIAHKLRYLGIINYRQLAECSPEQLQTIQTLLGENTPLPLAKWVKEARRLFREKYQNSPQHTTTATTGRNDPHSQAA